MQNILQRHKAGQWLPEGWEGQGKVGRRADQRAQRDFWGIKDTFTDFVYIVQILVSTEHFKHKQYVIPQKGLKNKEEKKKEEKISYMEYLE